LAAENATNRTAAVGRCLARRAVLAPLTEETFKIQFTASRGFRDKLRQAQDCFVTGTGWDLAAVLERALDLLIEDVKKERFAVGARPGRRRRRVGSSRHIPDAIKRAVYERDGERCTFADDAPSLWRDWSAGIRSRGRIRAYAPA